MIILSLQKYFKLATNNRNYRSLPAKNCSVQQLSNKKYEMLNSETESVPDTG
jgi:hypothetical protein